MDEFYYEETNGKHIFFKCLIFLFIVGLIIGIFIFFQRQNVIKLKNVKVELGTELSKDINDYLINGKKNSSKYKLYLDEVDINTIGKYTYKVKYNKHSKTGYINIVDTTKPIVELDNNVIFGVNEEFTPNIFITSCQDKSLPCNASLARDSDIDKFSKAGNYDIQLNISDSVGNITKKTVKVTVSETETLSSKVTNDLNYYINSENDDTIEHIFFIKLDKAINEDTLEYEGLIQETSAIDFSEYVSKEIYSTKLITVYNKYGYVIGIQVEVTFDDGTKELIQK